MTISKNAFKKRSIIENVKSISDSLFDGVLSNGRFISGTNFYNILYAMAKEFVRYETTLQEIIDRYVPNFNDIFLYEWEEFVGIPDSIFDTQSFTTQERIRNVLIKLAYMNIQTAADIIKLGDLFGYSVQVIPGLEYLSAPLNYTTYVVVTGAQTSGFTYTFDFQFVDNNQTLFESIVQKQKPAHEQVIFVYN